MLSIAGQTAGPIGLTFLVDNHGWPGGVIFLKTFFSKFGFKIFLTGNAGALHLVFKKKPFYVVFKFKKMPLTFHKNSPSTFF